MRSDSGAAVRGEKWVTDWGERVKEGEMTALRNERRDRGKMEAGDEEEIILEQSKRV